MSKIVKVIGRTLKDIVDTAQSRLAESTSQVRTLLNTRERGTKAGEINLLDHGSVPKYVATWKKLIAYVLRIWSSESTIEANPGNDKLPPPCTLNEAQMTATGALMRAQGNEARKSALVDLIYTLLRQQPTLNIPPAETILIVPFRCWH
ncbi:hypothetical protein L209DRAFT_348406 [Thermothelomyces heterothallicus CBS 203.75]